MIETGGSLSTEHIRLSLFLELCWLSRWGKVFLSCALGLVCNVLTVLIVDLTVTDAMGQSPSSPLDLCLAHQKDVRAAIEELACRE